MEVKEVIKQLASYGVNAYEENGEIIYKITASTWGHDEEINEMTKFLLKNRADTVSYLRRRDFFGSRARREALNDYYDLRHDLANPGFYQERKKRRWGDIMNKYFGRTA